MAINQQFSQLFTDFSGGLNTESNPLNVPAKDSLDLLNMRLGIDGGFGPRGGFDFAGTATGSQYAAFGGLGSTYSTTYGQFRSPGGGIAYIRIDQPQVGERKFVVFHAEKEIHFHEYSTIEDLVEMGSPDQILKWPDANNKGMHERTYFLEDGKNLIVINKENPTLRVSLNKGGVFEAEEIDVSIRVLSGDELKDTTDINPDSAVTHNGNWYTAIQDHRSTADDEPGAGDDWEDFWLFQGRIPTGLAGTTGWGLGNEYTTNVSSIRDKLGVKWFDPEYFATGVISEGRLWLAGITDKPNSVFFSQTIGTNNRNYGRMYQFADPYSAQDSTLVDTDGGELTIKGAGKILRLVEYNSGVLVFAANGVWWIHGNDIFRPTDFSINKVTDYGIAGPDCAVRVEGSVVFYGETGIYKISPDEAGLAVSASLIDDKIRSFYASIPQDRKQQGFAAYNPSRTLIYFFTNFESQTWMKEDNPNNVPGIARDVLVLNTRLGAWYKYSIPADTTGDKLNIMDVTLIPYGVLEEEDVTDSALATVTDSALDTVTADSGKSAQSEFRFLTLMGKNRNDLAVDIAFGLTDTDSKTDFSLDATQEESFTAYLETAYQDFDDLILRKGVPYIHFLFKRVEDFVLVNGVDTNPGSCLLSVNWNWSTNSASPYYANPNQTQIYHPDRFGIAYAAGTDPGVSTVRHKERIEGDGNVLTLRFDKDGDKEFYLYGWQMQMETSRRMTS